MTAFQDVQKALKTQQKERQNNLIKKNKKKSKQTPHTYIHKRKIIV